MPKYTFTFRKDDIYIEFTTTDKATIERQFKIWVTCASVYAYDKESAGKKPAETVTTQPQQLVKKPEPVAFEPEMSTPDELLEDLKKNSSQPQSLEQTPTINSIQNPESEPQPLFEDILETSIENPTFQPNPRKDERFIKLLNIKNATSMLEKLITSAYYLCEYERQERFSLKSINTKLMQNIGEVIDHAVLQEAIDKGLVESLPDLTGIGGVTEYRLSEDGEGLFLNGYEA